MKENGGLFPCNILKILPMGIKIKEEEYVKSRDFFNKSLSGNTNAYVTLKSTDLVNCINFIIVKKTSKSLQ